MSNSIHLLKTKRFLPLFITQFFGAFNDNAFKNAFLIWFTYDVAHRTGMDAQMMVTLAGGIFVLPFFLFSATAGQVADKYQKSWLTQRIKQVEILLMIACGVCFFMSSVYGLLVVLFLMGAQSAFFGPIKYSLLPEHLDDGELIAGNGLIEGGTLLSILLGTIFGGLVILMDNGVELLSLVVVSFAVIGWLASWFIPDAAIGDGRLKIGWNIARETWNIVGHARKEPIVWKSIIGISWFWLIGAIFVTQFPIYTKEIIGGNEHIVTLFLTIFSIGVGVGSVWCNRLSGSKINGGLVPYGSIGITLAIIAFVVASMLYAGEYAYYTAHSLSGGDAILGLSQFFEVGVTSWGVVLSLFVLSVCAGIYIVPLYTIMQHRSDGRYLARIIAANNVLNAFFMVLATIGVLALYALDFTVIHIFLIVGLANTPLYFFVRRVVNHSA